MKLRFLSIVLKVKFITQEAFGSICKCFYRVLLAGVVSI